MKKYRHLKCEFCGRYLTSPDDLVIYNKEMQAGVEYISQLSFRHGLGRGCDDKAFQFSRYVKDGYDDLLTAWSISPFNPDTKLGIL
jgi:hypothetical protein